MNFVFNEVRSLKDLMIFFKRSQTDPSTFYRFFGNRSGLSFSLLDPKVILSDLRRNARFLQSILLTREFVPLVIFIDLENSFLRRQLSLLCLKTDRVALVDIKKIDLHTVFDRLKGDFCCVSLCLASDLENQVVIQARTRHIPLINFRSPISHEFKGDGGVVSNIDTSPAQFFIVYFLCNLILQVLGRNS